MSEEKKKSYVEKIAKFIPTVKKPTFKQPLNTRLKWTFLVLLTYFVLSFVTVYGVERGSYERLRIWEILLGSKFGSLITLGIGPIVTGGIILQLLVGSKIVDWDLTEAEDRKKFQAWEKVLAILFCFLEAGAFVMGGMLPIAEDIFLKSAVFFQLVIGGIIIILLDDIVSKWGMGSGISLFIAAGVASQLFIRILSPLSIACTPGDVFSCFKYTSETPPSGLLWQAIFFGVQGELQRSALSILPIFTTMFMLLLIIFIQAVGIDIPIGFSALRGFGRVWNVKLLYTSNIPVILAAALIANLQLIARMGLEPTPEGMWCSLLACYDAQGNLVSGVMYYLTSPTNLIPNLLTGTLQAKEVIRAITYLVFLTTVATIFSVFWVSTSGMDPASVAEQLSSMGLYIPGYRSDKKSIEAFLNRYIPYLAILGGVFIGLLAATADFLGVIGSGTGILLTVMIIYNYYEMLQAENLEEAHPLVRKVVGW